MRRILGRSAPLLVALALLVASVGSASATRIKFALSVPESPLATVEAAKAFKSYVEARSNGAVQVELFFGTLGGERELTEQVKQGTLEMAVSADGAATGFFKPLQLFAIPYLFASSPVAWEFFDHPFARKLQEDMRRQTGIRTLTYAENGFRNITNSRREIQTPDDMKGLKMRVMESPVFIRFMQSLGAAATPISFSELVISLKQGVVDGQENATPDIYENGMADVQKFMSVNEHIYSVNLVLVNDAFYQGLPHAEQRLIAEGARLWASLVNARKSQLNQDYLQKIAQKGVKIHVSTPDEKEAFRKVSQEPVKAYIASQVGDELVQGVLAAVADSERAVYGR